MCKQVLQFTDGKTGEVKLLSLKEAVKVGERIITSKIARDCLSAGIKIVADGGEYRLVDVK